VARFIPFELSPLRPTLVKPFHRPGWVYEEKVDGWRLVAYKAAGKSAGRATLSVDEALQLAQRGHDLGLETA
jgi:hypothetical protein